MSKIVKPDLTYQWASAAGGGSVAPVISDAALADDAEITIDIDQIGDGTAKGLKITLIGTRA